MALPVAGVILPIGLIFLFSGLIVNVIQALIFVLVRPISKSFFRRMNRFVAELLWLEFIWLVDWWANLKVHVYADSKTFKSLGQEHALVICNHRSDIDWLVGWVLAQRAGCLGSTLAVMKKSSKFLPSSSRLLLSELSPTERRRRRLIGVSRRRRLIGVSRRRRPLPPCPLPPRPLPPCPLPPDPSLLPLVALPIVCLRRLRLCLLRPSACARPPAPPPPVCLRPSPCARPPAPVRLRRRRPSAFAAASTLIFPLCVFPLHAAPPLLCTLLLRCSARCSSAARCSAAVPPLLCPWFCTLIFFSPSSLVSLFVQLCCCLFSPIGLLDCYLR
ncbi:uncharacterized protein LOC116253946 isoform X2 [Nymphaea colorata]|nr:uncharacterized protein LOC116253946 isoform X2 [Nymphaea colorata]